MKWIFSALLFVSLNAFAHGEDKPGPHDGYIKMPGGFHVELLPDTDGSFHIMLLDMNFENPTVKDSDIKGRIQPKSGKAIELKCSVMAGNHYHCIPEKKWKDGKLFLRAKRDGQQGNEISYDLPLKPWKTDKKESKKDSKSEDHSHH